MTEIIPGLQGDIPKTSPKGVPFIGGKIDDAVRRILRVKFTMGLFENPYADLSMTGELGKKVSPFLNGSQVQVVGTPCLQIIVKEAFGSSSAGRFAEQ
ncbi:beta-glucosidase [Apostasia shenzhenica]|uniref:Beta-glucosidase n=1 Tax=Apostasia shenzhenica TaxID=1088818 RepID=A0A2I0A9S9_9ASPA|nr:beta-glucosidase [Apostasia shenzhenica]